MDFSVFGENEWFVREQFERFLSSPDSLDPHWEQFFSELLGQPRPGRIPGRGGALPVQAGEAFFSQDPDLRSRAARYVTHLRAWGHYRAKTNPLSRSMRLLAAPEYTFPDYFRFTEEEKRKTVPCNGFLERDEMLLGEMLAKLEDVYAGSIGYEYYHLSRIEEIRYLRSRIESFDPVFTKEERREHFRSLLRAYLFERDLLKRFTGQKIFSLEGAETLVPMLRVLLERSAQSGAQDVLVAMSHRGRLNVLVNVIGKPLHRVYMELLDRTCAAAHGGGDVKYHLGHSWSYWAKNGRSLGIHLPPNPSHLEAIDPVLEGMTRARQDTTYGGDRAVVLPVMVHGDAALSGQGVVYETFNFSRVPGYDTGGTVHLVVNNQVGFTATPDEMRSSPYCTDIAKLVGAPIFHVNAEDVDAACRVTAIALDFRNRFGRDVVIELVGYRKHGHNEGDDPTFTQPGMYAEIQSKEPIAKMYEDRLLEEGVLRPGETETFTAQFAADSETEFSRVNVEACPPGCTRCQERPPCDDPPTGVKLNVLGQVAHALTHYPAGFRVHPKLGKLLEKRTGTLDAGEGIDWGFAEALAFGSVVLAGKSVRLSGQDSGRGTFSQRHLMLDHYERDEVLVPLKLLEREPGAGTFDVFNSPLSEYGVLGFEFGYSVNAPAELVLWEAQFGDFANGAQVIIDQFLACSEVKWQMRSGLVLLLPHGYEGGGAEHSSARLERFLSLCADGNMTVCYPTNAKQYFHLLRRQALASVKRPLVVMTPKSLLRLSEAATATADLVDGRFMRLLTEDFGPPGEKRHVVLMAGKVFYALSKRLAEVDAPVRVVRVEELYPFPEGELSAALKGVRPLSVHWLQEEPRNMGAWGYAGTRLREHMDLDPKYAGRPEAASTATGSSKRHQEEEQAFLDKLLSDISAR